MQIKVKDLTVNLFAKYGGVIQIPDRKADKEGDFGRWWANIVNCKVQGGEVEFGMCVLNQRKLVISNMERHLGSVELNAPLGGDMICLVGETENIYDKDFRPNPKKMEAFLVRKEQSILMKAGVWHGAAFPVKGNLAVLVALKKGTFFEDTYSFEFEEIEIVM